MRIRERLLFRINVLMFSQYNTFRLGWKFILFVFHIDSIFTYFSSFVYMGACICKISMLSDVYIMKYIYSIHVKNCFLFTGCLTVTYFNAQREIVLKKYETFHKNKTKTTKNENQLDLFKRRKNSSFFC